MCFDEICTSRQKSNTCKHCIHITGGQKLDLRSLIKYTILPELWDIFSRILSISSMSDSGFTLSNAGSYFINYPNPNPFIQEFTIGDNCEKENFNIYNMLTFEEFWSVMMYFLKRVNENFRVKRELKLKQLKSKT